MNLQPKKGWNEVMNEWKKVKIGDFLKERQGRYKPDDEAITKYKRLNKIDFSGMIHICEKPSKTDMIIVKQGDLVISGINISKGAIAVYQGKEPIKATIHYSSYIFNDSIVDLEYFKYFVKSQAFIETIRKDIKGGIKTEIKAKTFLSSEISIPNLQIQKQIVKKISEVLKHINNLNKEIELQKAYIKCLSQNILQKAIEGKLTEKWRLEHPLQKGNPDYDAQALFALIQKEKKPDKKKQVLIPIKETEKAFEIPNSWKWVRLGEIFEHKTGKTLNSSNNKGTIKKKYITTSNLYWDYFDFAKMKDMNFTENEIEKYLVKKGDLLVCEGGDVGRSAIWNYDYSVCYQNHIHRLRSFSSVNMKFYYFILYLYKISGYINSQSKGMGIQSLSANRLGSFVIPLPPLSEQKEIVKIVDTSLSKITELEKEISIREEYINKLEKSILKNAFKE